MRMVALALLACALGRGQTADDCKPSSLNIPGAPYPCVHADRSVTFRVAAPEWTPICAVDRCLVRARSLPAEALEAYS